MEKFSANIASGPIANYIRSVAWALMLTLTVPAVAQQDTLIPQEIVDDTEIKKEVVFSFSKDIIEKYGKEQGLALLTKYMLEEINTIRKNKGLEAIEINETLTKVAQDYAQYMVDKNHYSHYDLQGKDFSYRAKEAKYPWFAIGENISPGVSIEQAVTSWMDSRWHRAIISDPDATEGGVWCAFMEVDNRGMQKVRWVYLTGR